MAYGDKINDLNSKKNRNKTILKLTPGRNLTTQYFHTRADDGEGVGVDAGWYPSGNNSKKMIV